jgi:hypothetical protein
MDRLTSLTVFTRVVECSGFSAAAWRLNMSTTMVSSHVQALEDRLGARLLNRTTRKVSLTEVGKTYYERCAKIGGGEASDPLACFESLIDEGGGERARQPDPEHDRKASDLIFQGYSLAHQLLARDD